MSSTRASCLAVKPMTLESDGARADPAAAAHAD